MRRIFRSKLLLAFVFFLAGAGVSLTAVYLLGNEAGVKEAESVKEDTGFWAAADQEDTSAAKPEAESEAESAAKNAPDQSSPQASAQADMDQFFRQFMEEQGDINQMFNNFFNDDFFQRNRDPFAEMEKMREQMLERFNDARKGQRPFRDSFKGWFKGRFGDGSAADIRVREDDKFVYVEIESKDLDRESLKVRVQGDQIIVSGETRHSNSSSSDNSASRSYYISSFSRSVPVPMNADPEKMQVRSEKDRIILQFERLKTDAI